MVVALGHIKATGTDGVSSAGCFHVWTVAAILEAGSEMPRGQ